MADTSLVLFIDEIRSKTLLLLADVAEAESRFVPPGMQNHILWHAGHALIVTEWLTHEALRKHPQAPPGWFELFSWESRPGDVPAHRWPKFAAVRAELEAQKHRLLHLVKHLSEAELAAPAANHGDRSVRQRIVHAFHDEANHGGEIWLLRKLFRQQSGGPV